MYFVLRFVDRLFKKYSTSFYTLNFLLNEKTFLYKKSMSCFFDVCNDSDLRCSTIFYEDVFQVQKGNDNVCRMPFSL